jgi:chromosome partitioning protein
MKIASFVGQKGGVGKSTLARVLAVKAAHEGRRVLLGDFDLEQLSCIDWSATRLRNGIEPDIEARAFKSLKKLRKTVENFDLVVVDTRGLADELTSDVSQESDVVFLPTGTSMDDLRPTLALARRLAKSSKVGSKVVLVLSKVGRSERLLENARIVIDEAGFDVLSNVWPERDGFQADLDMGRAGSESHNPHLRESAQRIEAELFKLVMGVKKQGQ